MSNSDQPAGVAVDRGVRPLAERLQACIDDPMWADHAEVPKTLLRQVAEELTLLHVGDQESWLVSAQGNRYDLSDDPLSFYGGAARLARLGAGDEFLTADWPPSDIGCSSEYSLRGSRWRAGDQAAAVDDPGDAAGVADVINGRAVEHEQVGWQPRADPPLDAEKLGRPGGRRPQRIPR